MESRRGGARARGLSSGRPPGRRWSSWGEVVQFWVRREERTNRVSRQICWSLLSRKGAGRVRRGGRGGQEFHGARAVWDRVGTSGGRQWTPGVWGAGGRPRGALVPGVEADEWLRSPGEGPEPCKA